MDAAAVCMQLAGYCKEVNAYNVVATFAKQPLKLT